MNEEEDYPAYLKVCVLCSSDKKVRCLLDQIYTGQQAVEHRHKGIPVNEVLLKEFTRRIFEVHSDTPHFLCRELLQLSLGVQFSDQVRTLLDE